MNSKLRKACHRKAMHRNKYFRHGRTKELWNKYRKTRNEVTKLKTVSMKNYFSERCNNENFVKNPTQYWKTIKPFLADKIKEPRNNVTLQQNGKIINDPSIVSNIFNNYFRTVAMEIGNESPLSEEESLDEIFQIYEDHNSVKNIHSNKQQDISFNFNEVTVSKVRSLIQEIDHRKACGFDNMPPKLLKSAANELAPAVTTLVNKSVSMSHFPCELKKSELSPLFKDKDDLLTQNYRPLSVLSSLSKIFEKIYISPTHTSSMQELIMQGLQQKLEKSCFRCNKNTWHVESNHILQPPNYLLIVVNRFRYINNQFAKDKCSIPMDMTIVLGYHKFSLRATIDHHGPSIYSGHYTTSVNCCNRTFYCNDNKITEFDMINTKNSSTAYVVIYKLIT